MKKIFIFLIGLAGMLAMLPGCTSSVHDPEFAADEFYIHHFNSWAQGATIKVGDTYTNDNICVSPADGSVACSWTVDGELVSDTQVLVYTFNQAGTYEVEFKATRGGAVRTRKVRVVVSPE